MATVLNPGSCGRIACERLLPAATILLLTASCAQSSPLQGRPDALGQDWLTSSPGSPVFLVRDTESSLGPYAAAPKRIDLQDLVKMHGHPCDGLVVAAKAWEAGAAVLYPDGVIDRTDTGCISNNSPCFGDVSAYLSGGRIRFGTQKIMPEWGATFLMHRFSTGHTVRVTLHTEAEPAGMRDLEHQLKTGTASPEQMRRCQELQWQFARTLLAAPVGRDFTVEELPDFPWEPDAYEHLGTRSDTRNKNAKG